MDAKKLKQALIENDELYSNYLKAETENKLIIYNVVFDYVSSKGDDGFTIGFQTPHGHIYLKVFELPADLCFVWNNMVNQPNSYKYDKAYCTIEQNDDILFVRLYADFEILSYSATSLNIKFIHTKFTSNFIIEEEC